MFIAIRIVHGVNENPLLIPTCFGTQQEVRKQQKPHFTLFSCRYHNIKEFQIIFLLNTNIPHLLSTVRLCSPCRAPKQSAWIAISAPGICLFDCCFIQEFLFYNSTGKTNKESRIESIYPSLLHLVTLFSRPWIKFC